MLITLLIGVLIGLILRRTAYANACRERRELRESFARLLDLQRAGESLIETQRRSIAAHIEAACEYRELAERLLVEKRRTAWGRPS